MSAPASAEPAWRAALASSAAALRRVADYRLPPALDRRILDLGERKETLTPDERAELLAWVTFTRQRSAERLEAQAALRSLPSGAAIAAIEVRGVGQPRTTNSEVAFMSLASPPQSQTPAEVRDRFRRLAAEWKEQSRYLSNTAQMAMLKPYQRIIGMGWPAVPLILEELRRDPDQWFWALEAITEDNPVPPDAAGHVRRSAEAWVAWGRDRGLVGS